MHCQHVYPFAYLSKKGLDAAMHNLLGEHPLLIELANELDIAERASPRLTT